MTNMISTSHGWRVRISTSIELDGGPRGRIGAPAVRLLRELARRDTLAEAAAALELSYRHGWQLLRDAERRLGLPLVQSRRGRGSRLNAVGRLLAAALDEIGEQLAPEAAAAERALEAALAFAHSRSRDELVVHASHDLGLIALRELLGRRGGPALGLRFVGSIDAATDLLDGRCELAGFHLPADADTTLVRRLGRAVRERSLALFEFASRTQGLIVAHGNPLRLRGVADLAASGCRFINRQPDSGTRLLFDALCRAAHVAPARIRGYGDEEYTHLAVAATVAGGAADAGFGIAAAARRYRLGFVPLATERYLLGWSTALAGDGRIERLLAALRSREFGVRIERLGGYDGTRRGRPASL
jgi:molybdate transport repressor ModE-like protein